MTCSFKYMHYISGRKSTGSKTARSAGEPDSRIDSYLKLLALQVDDCLKH